MKIAILLLIFVFCTAEVPRWFPKHIQQLSMDEQDANSKDEIYHLPLTKTGTTIVGVCCSDGVIMGSDTRSTGQIVMDKNKLKTYKISSRIACCAAGTAADCEQLARGAAFAISQYAAKLKLAGESDLEESVVAAVSNIAISLLHSSKKRKPHAVYIVGGVDSKGPQLFQVEQGSGPIRLPYTSKGSGSTDALAVLEQGLYEYSRSRSPDMTIHNNDAFVDIDIDSAIKLVRRAVQAGILNDLGSGSHVDICVITRNGMNRWREWMVNPDQTEQSVYASCDEKLDKKVDETENLTNLGNIVWKKVNRLAKLNPTSIDYFEHDVVDPELGIRKCIEIVKY